MAKLSKHSGSALISALFIMTLVAIATTAMSVHLQYDIYRVRLSTTVDKLYLASQSVTFWAMDVLSKDPLPIEPSQFTYPKSLSNDYPSISLSGQMIDLQSKFNINQLIETNSDETNQRMLTSFFQLLNFTFRKNETLNRDIASATKSWVNERVKEKGTDEYSAFYQQQKPPYSPSNQSMQSITEFRLVRGVDEKIYQAMLPYITALPPPTLININTAPVPILMLLGDGLTEQEAESLVKIRGPQGFQSMEQVNEVLKKYNIHVDQITLESEYFLCIATAKTEGMTFIHYSLLKRSKGKNHKIVVHIIHDSLNEL